MSVKTDRYLVAMLDGFGLDYYQSSDMPELKRLASEGLFREGRAVFPTLTNANNISIVCGTWPETHGVATNCYFDRSTGSAHFLEDPSFLKSPTLFEKAKARGLHSALLTGKAKTLRILGDSVDVGVAAQEPEPHVVQRYGAPPDIYSSEVNFWLWKVAIDLLEKRRDIGVLYVHTTDYAMHRWGPQEQESLKHLHTIDQLIGETVRVAPDAALMVTADHGMNPKKRCLDLYRICREAGLPVLFALSPVADRLVLHHGGHGGVSYVYTDAACDRQDVLDFISTLSGVEEVLPGEQAAARYHLPADRIGDLVVVGDRETVFGTLAEKSEEQLRAGYRNHGSHHEEGVPLIAWNLPNELVRAENVEYNFDLTRLVFFA
jgi:phosphonoacetate hydrolase